MEGLGGFSKSGLVGRNGFLMLRLGIYVSFDIAAKAQDMHSFHMSFKDSNKMRKRCTEGLHMRGIVKLINEIRNYLCLSYKHAKLKGQFRPHSS